MDGNRSSYNKRRRARLQQQQRVSNASSSDAASQVFTVLSFEQEDRIRVDEGLRQRQAEFLLLADTELKPLSEKLTGDACWNYFCTHLVSARRLLCEHSFRMLCDQYLEKFQTGRFARLTQRYSDRR